MFYHRHTHPSPVLDYLSRKWLLILLYLSFNDNTHLYHLFSVVFFNMLLTSAIYYSDSFSAGESRSTG